MPPFDLTFTAIAIPIASIAVKRQRITSAALARLTASLHSLRHRQASRAKRAAFQTASHGMARRARRRQSSPFLDSDANDGVLITLVSINRDLIEHKLIGRDSSEAAHT